MKVTIKYNSKTKSLSESKKDKSAVLDDVLIAASSFVTKTKVFLEPYRLNRFYDEDISAIKKALVSKSLQILGRMKISVDPADLSRKADLKVKRLISGELEILESNAIDDQAKNLKRKLADIKIQKAKDKLNKAELSKKKISQ